MHDYCAAMEDMKDMIIPEGIEDQIELLSELLIEQQKAKSVYDKASDRVEIYKEALYSHLNKRLIQKGE